MARENLSLSCGIRYAVMSLPFPFNPTERIRCGVGIDTYIKSIPLFSSPACLSVWILYLLSCRPPLPVEFLSSQSVHFSTLLVTGSTSAHSGLCPCDDQNLIVLIVPADCTDPTPGAVQACPGCSGTNATRARAVALWRAQDDSCGTGRFIVIACTLFSFNMPPLIQKINSSSLIK